MLRDWIYNHPTLEVGVVITALSVIASWIGLYVFDRFVHVSIRSRHNDRIVQTEANLVGNLYRDAASLPDTQRVQVRQSLAAYLDTVVKKEWPAQRTGHFDPVTWEALGG